MEAFSNQLSTHGHLNPNKESVTKNAKLERLLKENPKGNLGPLGLINLSLSGRWKSTKMLGLGVETSQVGPKEIFSPSPDSNLFSMKSEVQINEHNSQSLSMKGFFH